jgi:hypothetical protein
MKKRRKANRSSKREKAQRSTRYQGAALLWRCRSERKTQKERHCGKEALLRASGLFRERERESCKSQSEGKGGKEKWSGKGQKEKARIDVKIIK